MPQSELAGWSQDSFSGSEYRPEDVTEEMSRAFVAGRECYLQYSVLSLEVRSGRAPMVCSVFRSASGADLWGVQAVDQVARSRFPKVYLEDRLCMPLAAANLSSFFQDVSTHLRTVSAAVCWLFPAGRKLVERLLTFWSRADQCGPASVFLAACLHGSVPAPSSVALLDALIDDQFGKARNPKLPGVVCDAARDVLPHLLSLRREQKLLEDVAFDAFADFVGKPIVVLGGSKTETGGYAVVATVHAGHGVSINPIGRSVSEFCWIWHSDVHYQLALPVGDLMLAQAPSTRGTNVYWVLNDADTDAARLALPPSAGTPG